MNLDPNTILITLDLPRLGELAAAIADAFAEHRGIEPFDIDSGDARVVAEAAWDRVVFMFDRAEFARSVESDLSQLDSPDATPKARLGGESPIGWDPPV